MDVDTPTLKPAIQAVTEYEQRHYRSLSAEHTQILLEIRRRLMRLDAQASELIEINNRMWRKQDSSVNFDPATDMVVFKSGEATFSIKLNRAKPNVPIEMVARSGVSAYHSGETHSNDEEDQRLQVLLEDKIESYYQSAHRILKLFGRIPNLSKIKCVAISRVRNELIEHAEDGSLYTFGVGSTGPRVKPMYQGELKFNDEGLVPNTNNFVTAIIAVCSTKNTSSS